MSDNQANLFMPDPIFDDHQGFEDTQNIDAQRLQYTQYNMFNNDIHNPIQEQGMYHTGEAIQQFNNHEMQENNYHLNIQNLNESQYPFFQDQHFDNAIDFSILNPNFNSQYQVINPLQQSSHNLIDPQINNYNINNEYFQPQFQQQQATQQEGQEQNNYYDNEEPEQKQLERNIMKQDPQIQNLTTRNTFHTSLEKYKNLGDNEDDTKNLLRNYFSRLKRDINDTKNDRNQNKWIIQLLHNYSTKKQISNADQFIEQFLSEYCDKLFGNFQEVRESWKVKQDDPDFHLKNAYKELCFFFFSKNPLNYIYRESNKVNKKSQRFTHLKYLSVFLQGLIDPPSFQKFKQAPQKQKKEIKSTRHTTY